MSDDCNNVCTAPVVLLRLLPFKGMRVAYWSVALWKLSCLLFLRLVCVTHFIVFVNVRLIHTVPKVPELLCSSPFRSCVPLSPIMRGWRCHSLMLNVLRCLGRARREDAFGNRGHVADLLSTAEVHFSMRCFMLFCVCCPKIYNLYNLTRRHAV